jgi:hypothetical protein
MIRPYFNLFGRHLLRQEIPIFSCYFDHFLKREYKVEAGDLKAGDIVNLDEEKIYMVTKSTFHTWGRGGSFVNVDFKDIKNGNKKSERYRTADTIESTSL